MTSSILFEFDVSGNISSKETIESVSSLNDNYITSDSKIKAEIYRLTRKESNIIGVYKNLLRSILNYFSDIVYIDSENKIVPVKCIFANPEKVIGLLTKDNAMVLPIISISQESSQTDKERSRYKSILVHEKFFDSEKNKAVRILSIAPVPVDITYNVNIFTKYKEDQDQLTEQVRLKFNPDADLVIPGHDLIKAYLVESENFGSGSFEANDREDRVLKKSFSVEVKTYINNPKFLFTNTGSIERLKLDF